MERSVLLAKTSTANESDVALGAVWAQANLLADTCGRHEEARARADIISTPFVARDMMRIVDALGGDRRLRYWGKRADRVPAGARPVRHWLTLGLGQVFPTERFSAPPSPPCSRIAWSVSCWMAW